MTLPRRSTLPMAYFLPSSADSDCCKYLCHQGLCGLLNSYNVVCSAADSERSLQCQHPRNAGLGLVLQSCLRMVFVKGDSKNLEVAWKESCSLWFPRLPLTPQVSEGKWNYPKFNVTFLRRMCKYPCFQ